MRDLEETEKQKLRQLVDRITTFSIEENQNPNGFCFSTSFALSIYLDSQNIANLIKGTTVNGIDHYWLNLTDFHDNVIIDATIKQFDSENKQDLVYIGEKSMNEITCQYQSEFTSFNDWIQTYYTWSNPNIDKNGNPRAKDLVNKIVLNNLINASILRYEIEKLDSLTKERVCKSPLYRFYFTPIIKWLKKNQETEIELLNSVKNKVKNEFEFMLSKIS